MNEVKAVYPHRFNTAFDVLMELEGWDKIVDDPDDPGGVTKYGISLKSFPSLNIKTLTLERAKSIYYYSYWYHPNIGKIENAALALKVFCTGVLTGTKLAISKLQTAVNVLLEDPIKVDGMLGPKTANAINSIRHPEALEELFEAHMTMYVVKLENRKFLQGWLRRIDMDLGK
jgi:lysozyme family protein